jgi:NAD(P)-dependent dehydrogenase (short-subunit alcohol dehydrogenase family)
MPKADSPAVDQELLEDTRRLQRHFGLEMLAGPLVRRGSWAVQSRSSMDEKDAPGAGGNVHLLGQVALATGDGRGIGRAVARALAAAGATVAAVARSPDQLAETVALVTARGGHARAYPADVTDRAALTRVVEAVERELGAVDLLVNNAGVGGPTGPTWEADPDEWCRCVEVNLCGPLLSCRLVLPGMVARRHGRVINVASGVGTRPIPHLSAYSASKAALIRLTETLAAEAADHGDEF